MEARKGGCRESGPRDGEEYVLVEVPAQYKTVSKQVLVKPATIREVETPAQYEMRAVPEVGGACLRKTYSDSGRV